MNFLTEHGLDTYPDLESRVAEITAASEEAAAALKTAERRLGEMAVLIKPCHHLQADPARGDGVPADGGQAPVPAGA